MEGMRKLRRPLFPHCMGRGLQIILAYGLRWERNKNQGFHYCKCEWALRMEGRVGEKAVWEAAVAFKTMWDF